MKKNFFENFRKFLGKKSKISKKSSFQETYFQVDLKLLRRVMAFLKFFDPKNPILKGFWSPNWGDFFTFISVLKTLKNGTKIIPIRWPEPLQKWPQKLQLLAISLRERFQACSRGRIGMKNRHFVERKKRYKMVPKSSRFDLRNPFKRV